MTQSVVSNAGPLDELRFHFEQIVNRDDVWISPVLCQRLLEEVLREEETDFIS